MMRISICIPQYNRIEYLKINLEKIALQKNADIEVIVSDDASTDDTPMQISEIQTTYPFPLVYFRFEQNQGYDRNLRKSLELAKGEYCFILGNDDTLNQPDDIEWLVKWLTENQKPDVGFCNSSQFSNVKVIISRASENAVIGKGPDIAIKYYRSFSFVAGIIIKKSVFKKFNTNLTDGSIYSQMYFCTKIIVEGNSLFTLNRPMVLQQITLDSKIANSYLDTLPKKLTDYKPVNDGGLHNVIYVTNLAFSKLPNHSKYTYLILKGIYKYTYTFWLFDYRRHHSYISSINLASGLFPLKIALFKSLNIFRQFYILFFYTCMTLTGLLLPVTIFKILERKIYAIIKK